MNTVTMGRRTLAAVVVALLATAATTMAAPAETVNGARVDGAEPGEWTHDWDAATAAAKKDGKPVFVNFTGSDWCPWCKVLERQVFSQAEWRAWASNHVYLVRVDFPNDKSLVPEKYRDRNRELSRRYKVGGYPTCHLFDPADLEKPIGRFGASRDVSPSIFIEKVSAAMPGASAGTGSIHRAAQSAIITTNDFKAVLTGVAIVDRKGRDKPGKATFVPPETKVEVPYGKSALFRVEYDFPEGYEARVWTRDGMCEDGKSHSWYFGSNPSGLFKGKGIAYGFLRLLDRGKRCRVRELLLRTSTAPDLDNSPREWTIASVPVDVEFLEMTGGSDTDTTAESSAFVNGARVDGANPGEWTHDWDAATAAAKKSGKPVFVNFTGSDWCGWCKLLKQQVFSTPEWGAWASNHVYLVHLDFPNDKALVPEKYRDRNRELSRRYNVGGFPTCYLLDPATLDPLGRFGASKDANPATFIEQVSVAMPGAKKSAPAAEPRRPDRPRPVAPPAAKRPEQPAAAEGADASTGRPFPVSGFTTDGLVAGFTFDREYGANDFVKKGRQFQVGGLPPRWNKFAPADALAKDGVLRVPGEYKWEFFPRLAVPELRYDRFTVVMDFLPRTEPGESGPLLSFNSWFWIWLLRDGSLEIFFSFSDRDFSRPLPAKFRPGEWNRIAVSFDPAERRLSAVLNGRRLPDVALPDNLSFKFARESRETCREVQFGAPSFGKVFKGDVGGFLLYDRAFAGEALEAMCAAPAAPAAAWTFRADEEGAVFHWNGMVSDGVTTLDARIAGGEASVLFPFSFSVPGGVLDLGKDILDEHGAKVPLVGIGSEEERSFVGSVGHRRDATEVRLPATLRFVGPGAFADFASLARIDVPESVRRIGSAAFDGCRSLRTFRVGPAVEFFSSDRVFMGCEALEAIEVDPANARYKTVDGALFTADGKRLVAFPPGRKGPFAIPAGVEEIPPRAFLRCRGLTRVSVPASVKRIGEYAFTDCPALERIEFEDRSFRLDDRVFGSPRNGETVHRPSTNLGNE